MDNFKITQNEIDKNNVKSAANSLRGDPEENKNVFDKLPELIAKKFNNFIEFLKTAMLTEEDLQEATNDALAQAKASGEFDGESVTITDVTENTNDGGTNLVLFSDGTVLSVQNGKKGSAGTSATHSWNGTILTIKSASGESSADLKGEEGDDGNDGLSVYYYNFDLDAGYHAIAKNDIDTFGRTIVAGDLVISRNGFLFKVDRTNATHANLTYCAELIGPEGSKGVDGFSIYKATAEPFYNEEADNYGIIREKVETEGRTVQVSDFVLSPEGKMYSVTSTMDSRTYMLKLYVELGSGGTGGGGGDGKDGLSVFKATENVSYSANFGYTLRPEYVETLDRTIQTGDFILTPDGKLYRVIPNTDTRLIYLEFYLELKAEFTESDKAELTEDVAEKLVEDGTIPTKTSQLENDSDFAQKSDIPTSLPASDVFDWAKQPSKPTYSKSDVGLGNVDNVKQYSASNPPPYPVTSVNGQGGDVEVEPKGTAETNVTNHNADDEAHKDIRLLISALTKKVNDLLDSDDTTLDQMSEVVAYIKANRELLESYTTEKVNVADIIDNLTTSVSNKPLSAKQGVQLKALIDGIKVPTDVSAFNNDAGYQTEAQVQTTVNNAVAELTADGIPEYWDTHLDSKIEEIKALQDKGGKDCFSFIVMADMHYPSNLGKNSPKLAKKILDKCDMRFALCLGDVQTRGCHETKKLLLAENEAIEEMLKPIRDRLLQTEGNHDGSYGKLDRDGNGISNTDSEGNYKEPAERETYVNNLTPAELHSWIYRKVGLVDDVHFDESGSGYYVDDVANKVRYIILNTHCNDYELQEDGTVKYPKMWIFRFTQPQFDLTIEALNSIPSDSWNVVVAGHCPLYQEIGDREIMQGVLNAYKNKTTYSGEYAGTAGGGAAYKNLAEPLPDNTTDTSKWVNGYRISSSGVSAQSGKTVTNIIPVSVGDVIRVKGVSFVSSADRVMLTSENSSVGAYLGGQCDYVSALPNSIWDYVLNGDVHEFTRLTTNVAYTHARFSFTTPENPNNVIITVNQPITESESAGYDAVSVDCDFTNAKGELTGYFAGHVHSDNLNTAFGFNIITTRCDAQEENTEALKAEKVAGTTTEQSFDVFTVNKAERKIYATKIGAGSDRAITY